MEIDPRIMQYVDDVESKKVLTCKWIQLAVKRFLSDVKKIKRKDYPYTFDSKKALDVVAFIEALKQYQDKFAGQYLHLEPWQVFVIANIYGWVRKDDGRRRFTKAFIFVARKNGKTMFVSALAPRVIITEKGAQVYIVATKADQASIAYENMLAFIKQNEGLQRRLIDRKSRKRIVCEQTMSYIQPTSRDNKSNDGLNPVLIIADECSAMKDWGALKVMLSGTGARSEPLTIEITTGGENIASVGMQEYEVSKKVLTGETEADNFFTVLYTLDEGDDWKDPKNYIKANPNLGISVQMESLVRARDDALLQPYLESEFKAKNLNLFVSPITAWITESVWKRAMQTGDKIPTDLSPFYYCGGVDLAKVSDFTAYTKYFWIPEIRKFIAKHNFYLPSGPIDERFRKDAAMIRKWVDEGHITVSGESVVDHGPMFDLIKRDAETYRIPDGGGIAYDPYYSFDLIKNCDEFVDLIPFKQCIAKLSPAGKAWEKSILSGEIIDNNPVMRWMVSCVAVKRFDDDNIKIRKDDSGHGTTKRIDGVITSIMARDTLVVALPPDGEALLPEQVKKAIDIGTAYGY